MVEDRPIISVKYCLPVSFLHFSPKLTHPAARSLCDSWASCDLYYLSWPQCSLVSSACLLIWRHSVLSVAMLLKLCRSLLHHSSASPLHLLLGLLLLFDHSTVPNTICFSSLSSGVLNIWPKRFILVVDLTNTRINNHGMCSSEYSDGQLMPLVKDMIVLWGSVSGLIVKLPCVAQVLFDELQLDTRLPDKSKSISRTVASREKSTSEAVLKRLTTVHPLPALVLQHRQVKLRVNRWIYIARCVKHKCLPILMYALEVRNLYKRILQSLDFTVNRFFMKLFRTSNIEIVHYSVLFLY